MFQEVSVAKNNLEYYIDAMMIVSSLSRFSLISSIK